ncbi:hypothetical protein NDU88_003906 [Pleurodeles waltl]|uniref:Uncharacterized protein n=1 Tax=Pleurodeles waltl TaxID=8319 RepID=A0AAV7WUC4_PLEWA|nr:hypothetical protein NDU88_003906 [Pleurodeles waltl]
MRLRLPRGLGVMGCHPGYLGPQNCAAGRQALQRGVLEVLLDILAEVSQLLCFFPFLGFRCAVVHILTLLVSLTCLIRDCWQDLRPSDLLALLDSEL